jgi:hypothetical protein
VRLRDFPLERDEGEYAYAGQLILQGIPPYQLAYNMKLPGTYAAYALIMAFFGQTPAGIHLGVLLVHAATIVLLYLLAARLFGRLAGVVAAASYMLLASSETVLGLAGHTEHFVVLPAVGGLLFLLKAVEQQRKSLFFWSGLLMGLCFLMKQPGIMFAIFGGLYLLLCEQDRAGWKGLLARLGAYSAGVALPFLLTCLVLFKAGVFPKFWFWTFSYARLYASTVSLRDGILLFANSLAWIAQPFLFLLLGSMAGFAALWGDRAARTHLRFVDGLFLFSFLALSAGLYYRGHYFIVVWPVVALLLGAAVSVTARHISARKSLQLIPALCFLLACGYAVYYQRELLFEMGPLTACRMTYGENPFPEAVEVAQYIRSHSSPDARIAVLGSEPEICFYAQRRSATGYIYTYGLMEPQKYAEQMQKEMIGEIEAAKPEFLVFADLNASWLVSPRSDTTILGWAKQYIATNYELVGIADIALDTAYRWEDEARAYQPRSRYKMLTFRRKARP